MMNFPNVQSSSNDNIYGNIAFNASFARRSHGFQADDDLKAMVVFFQGWSRTEPLRDTRISRSVIGSNEIYSWGVFV